MNSTQEESLALKNIRQRLAHLEKELREVGFPPAPGSKFARIGTDHLDPSEVETLSRERERRYAAASSEYNRLRMSESVEMAQLRAEAAQRRLDELIAGDAGVAEAAEQHRQALAAVDELAGLLREVEAKIEKFRGAAARSLGDTPLGHLFKVARGKAGTVEDLRAAELARDEIKQRLATAEAQVNEAMGALRSAQRVVMHRHIDELIGASSGHLVKLKDALGEIYFWEERVRLLGGRRHAFISQRVRNEIEAVCDHLDAEVVEIKRLSEPY